VTRKKKRKQIKEAEELLKYGKYKVRDVNHVRQIIKKGNGCSDETYMALTRLIAEEGALVIPLREHPQLKEIWEQEKENLK